MPIIKELIEAQILSALKANKKEGEEGIKQFSSDLANIITNAIKMGTVTISPGIPVQVVPTTGTGSTVAPGTGVIN